MTQRKIITVLLIMVLFLCVALVVQAFAGRERRREICKNQNNTLNVISDLIALSTRTPPGVKLTPTQAARVATFQTKATIRIDAARC